MESLDNTLNKNLQLPRERGRTPDTPGLSVTGTKEPKRIHVHHHRLNVRSVTIPAWQAGQATSPRPFNSKSSQRLRDQHDMLTEYLKARPEPQCATPDRRSSSTIMAHQSRCHRWSRQETQLHYRHTGSRSWWKPIIKLQAFPPSGFSKRHLPAPNHHTHSSNERAGPPFMGWSSSSTGQGSRLTHLA